MFCPNCRFENQNNTEFCLNCGVRLGKRTDNLNLNEKLVQCRYCGNLTGLPRCEHCGRWIDKSTHPNKFQMLFSFIYAIPGELKSFKWDDTFVKSNLVIIVAIMGLLVITMLIMNYF